MHETRVELSPAPLPEVEAGAEVCFRVEVSCSSGCNLVGKPIRILSPAADVVHETRLTIFQETVNHTEELILPAPGVVGDCGWRVVFPPVLERPIGHDEASVAITTKIRAHTTSVAVWDVGSPVVVGHPTNFNIGIKCSSACCLKGQTVEVVDPAGVLLGSGVLGPKPWPGTSALYWTQCELTAFRVEGTQSCTVRFPVPKLDLPHEPAMRACRVIAVRPPEHVLTVRVVEKGANMPVDDAEVRFGAYRGRTDGAGFAKLELPKGKHAVHVWKEGYALSQHTLDVREDRTLRIEIEAAPEPEEEYWM